MSDHYDTVSDDVFANFVKQQQEAAAAQDAKIGGGNFSGDFEQIKYCAAPKEGHAIVRFVGNPPKEDGTNVRPTDCIERHISKIKDDQGKIMYLVLPCRADTLEQDHLMWRIISRVKERTWIDKKSVYVNQTQHPDIWEIVTKGGYKPEDGFSYTYAEGWDAKRKLLINCIDRTDNWCKENKHTKVFSKNISVSDKGVEFADMGVKSYGFMNKLVENISTYGNWEKYDSYVMRIGQKTEPFRILNASAYKKAGMRSELKGVTETELAAISLDDHLTAEEREYERYDLEKHFKVSSYQKILKRLGNSIKAIDSALSTHFYDELVTLAQKEKEAYQVDNEAKVQLEAQNKVVESTTQAVPVSQPAPSAEVIPEVKAPVGPTFDQLQTVGEEKKEEVKRSIAADTTADHSNVLPHFNDLSDAEKSLFKNVTTGPDGLPVAEFIETAPAALPCPKCNFSEPSSITICANCGAHFAS